MPFKFIDRLFAFLCVPIRSNIGSIGIEMIFCVNNRHPNIHKSSIQIRDIWVFNSKKSSNRWTCATISRFYWICDRLVTNSIQIGSWKHIEHDFLFASELTCDKKNEYICLKSLSIHYRMTSLLSFQLWISQCIMKSLQESLHTQFQFNWTIL